jgi:hypothetical protein
MSNRVLLNTVRFFTLIVLQMLVFNHIQFSGYINPYFYVLFILLLPFETPGWLMLILSFLLGLSIDFVSDTHGLHTMATVFMAYIRPFMLRGLAPRDGYEPGTYPRITYYGLGWFAKYAIILIVLHHLVLFYVEIFRLSEFFSTLLRVILSSIFTFIFIVISQYFIYRK